MSAGSPNPSEQHTSGTATSHDAAVAQVEAFFQLVAANPVQPRMRHMTGVCQFDITGAGRWQGTVKEGVITVAKLDGQSSAPSTCVITTTAEDFARILRREGHMNMTAAMLQGLVTVTGDLAFAFNVIQSYTVELVGSPTR